MELNNIFFLARSTDGLCINNCHNQMYFMLTLALRRGGRGNWVTPTYDFSVFSYENIFVELCVSLYLLFGM